MLSTAVTLLGAGAATAAPATEPTVTATSIDSCYLACGSPAVVRSGTPTLSATAVDPGGATMRLEFEVYDETKSVLKAASGTAVTGVTSGSTRSWRVGPFTGTALPDATYQWRVRACDSSRCGDYSPWKVFRVTTASVPTPAVSGDPYTEATWAGGVGQSGQFTFSSNASSDVVEYLYSLNQGNMVARPAGELQGEQLSANQQQISTDTTGFEAGNSTLARADSLGHASPDSLQVTPLATGGSESGADGDTYATLGEDSGGMRLGMQAGRRYLISGWIYVPAETGLNPGGAIGAARGLRLVAFYKVGPNTTEVRSAKATVTGGWQKLSVHLVIPAEATSAYVRLYNGFGVGSGKSVHWDDLSVRELSGTTTVEIITPTVDGSNTLTVQAVNLAGNVSQPRAYRFFVTPTPTEWLWRLDERSGTTAASRPGGHPVSFSSTGVSWFTPGRVGTAGVTLDGSGELTTSSAVVDTADLDGFTVAAWVQLTDPGGVRTAVSQDGTQTSMFRLGFRNDRDLDGDGSADDAWCFSVAPTDTTGAPETAACTTSYVNVGEWVSLVGVYDKLSAEIKLYVNGTLNFGGAYASVEFDGGGWDADGSFAIGRGFSGGPTDRWIGGLDHIYAVQWIWSDSDIDMYALS